ncbi:MAG: S41 family peptidase, partial [bacterium]|nr:S41 family peptidase [bacterium]
GIGFFAFGVLFGNGTLGFGLFKFSPSTNQNVNLDKFWRVWDLVYKKYDGDVDKNQLITGATSGMVSSLGDPYTEYLTEAEAKELSNDLNGKLSGIGIEVGIKNNKLTVIAPIESTPAYQAGIRSGDIIASIDGVDSSTLTLDEAVMKIRGEAGSKVKLMIVRVGQTPKELEITRDNINVASVRSEVKTDGVGYIRIRRFGEDTASKIEEIAKQFSDQKVRGVVIDLRDNPGGYLDSSVDVSSQFINEGTVVVEEKSKFKDDKVLKATAGGKLTGVPIVILINNGSASASEIMAGALRDNGRATLVGEKTFGKGSVQEVVKLGDGSELKVTVAHWFTPKGVNISKDGIKADIEIKNSADDYNAGRDPQLEKAFEILNSKL